MTTTRTPWTPAENAALVRLYFAMLDRAIAGRPYNKAAMIRSAQTVDTHYSDGIAGKLANRSRGSIEAKLMNATACHEDLIAAGLVNDADCETMDSHGYRALPNYQRALRDAMRDELFLRSVGRGREAERSA